MDPLSIASAALATLAGIKKFLEAVEKKFWTATQGIHGALADLKEELDSLYGDIDNVHNICQDPEFNPAASASLLGCVTTSTAAPVLWIGSAPSLSI